MRSVNIHEAKTHLPRLVEQAAAGEPFIIAKSGKPIVKVTAIDTPARAERRRVGFLQGEIDVPHDFDEMGRSR
jgi:prevent-host-death family protein